MKQKYSIGLDIGTSSVGWAVVDENDELMRYKKKNMWGSRLFEEAEKAESRRMNRTARRRLRRREQRINFLQQIMAPVVLPADDAFFIKLNESMLHLDDKKHDPLKNSLEDAGYYQRKSGKLVYPTVYHLRKALMSENKKFDPRLVYLAIHHIIKYRGNFLYQGQNFDINNTQAIDENLTQAFEFLENNFGISLVDLTSKQTEIIAILRQNNKSKSQRKSDVMELFKLEKIQKTALEQIIKAFLGLAVNLHQIFTDLDKQSLDFSKFEEKREANDEALNGLSDEQLEYLELLQKIHSWVILQDVLRGEASISQAMINKYDDYARDLKFAKTLFKKHLSAREYKEFFKSKQDAKGQHSHYTKYSESGWNYEEFIKDFKKYFDKTKQAGADVTSEDAKRFVERLENKEAFSKLRMSDNGAIPYQLHEDELVKIIENQGKFYPELLEKVDNGDGQMKYALVRLIEHRIPYYVGPLQSENQNNSEFAWVKRRHSGDITPFNFYQKVDKIASAEAFIENLTNNCTYLPKETVLPKHSLLFSEFAVRNEIKNMRIDGEQPPIDLENKLFKELFLKKRKVTKKDVLTFLKTNQYPAIKNNGAPEITGLASETYFNSSMASYIDFVEKIGLDLSLEIGSSTYEMVENLIKWITVFEDKKILEEKISKEYGTSLSDQQIAAVCKLNYSGWASLSRKLLTSIKNRPDESDLGQSIIELMRTKKDNFMQIISSQPIKGRLDQALADFVGDSGKSLSYEKVAELPASPGIKRGIWQAVKLVEEIVELNGGQPPEKIYLEMARGGGKKGRTVERKKQLEKLHKSIELDGNYCDKDELEQVKKELERHSKIDRDTLMLYFLQLGKCAYSGRSINLDQITQTCEVEHILPQSLIKDNSLDNKVLVFRKFNQDKGGKYPLDKDIVESQSGLWRYWLSNKLISQTKFANLTKSEEAYEKEKISGKFIQRQLVETRQITKHVAALLDQRYRTSDDQAIVEPIKARITSEFRDKFNFPKSRSINDFHHAKDAYLAAVLGRFLSIKFENRKRSVLYERYMKYNNKLSSHDRDNFEKSFVLSGIEKDFTNKITGEIFDGKKRIQTIKKTMKYNDCLVTKKLSEINSGFYKINLVSGDSASVPRKLGLDLKYGGYTGIEKAYYTAVRYKEGGEKSKIIGISIIDSYVIKHGKLSLMEVVKNQLGVNAENIQIVRDKILKYQLINKDGSLVRLVSDSEVVNGKQLRLPADMEALFALLEKNFIDENYSERFVAKLNRLTEAGLSIDKPELISQFLAKKLDEIFNKYVCILEKEYKVFDSIRENIQKKSDHFYKLSISEKIVNLQKLSVLTKENSANPDFTEEFPIGKRVGRKSGQSFNLDNITFYDYSITGLKVKKTKL